MNKEEEEEEEMMMSGRRDRPLMRNSLPSSRRSRIGVAVVAVGIGFPFGCVFAFLYPHEFFGGASDSTIQNRRSTKNNFQVCSTQSELALRVNMLKMELFSISEKNAELKKQVRELKETQSESAERVNMLKMELVSTSEKNAELNKQVRELKEKLRLSEEREDQAQKQVQVLGETRKAGPFGNVKSLRTNTPVVPDDSVSSKFLSAHQAEIQYAKSGIMKILTSASQMMSGIIHPTYQTQGRNAVEAPPSRQQTHDSESNVNES